MGWVSENFYFDPLQRPGIYPFLQNVPYAAGNHPAHIKSARTFSLNP